MAIRAKYFIFLHNLILQNATQYFGTLSKKKFELYGYGPGKDYPYSVKNYLDAVYKEYINSGKNSGNHTAWPMNGKLLYEKFQQAQRNEDVHISDAYKEVYLIAAKLNSMDELIQNYEQNNVSYYQVAEPLSIFHAGNSLQHKIPNQYNLNNLKYLEGSYYTYHLSSKYIEINFCTIEISGNNLKVRYRSAHKYEESTLLSISENHFAVLLNNGEYTFTLTVFRRYPNRRANLIGVFSFINRDTHQFETGMLLFDKLSNDKNENIHQFEYHQLSTDTDDIPPHLQKVVDFLEKNRNIALQQIPLVEKLKEYNELLDNKFFAFTKERTYLAYFLDESQKPNKAVLKLFNNNTSAQFYTVRDDLSYSNTYTGEVVNNNAFLILNLENKEKMPLRITLSNNGNTDLKIIAGVLSGHKTTDKGKVLASIIIQATENENEILQENLKNPVPVEFAHFLLGQRIDSPNKLYHNINNLPFKDIEHLHHSINGPYFLFITLSEDSKFYKLKMELKSSFEAYIEVISRKKYTGHWKFSNPYTVKVELNFNQNEQLTFHLNYDYSNPEYLKGTYSGTDVHNKPIGGLAMLKKYTEEQDFTRLISSYIHLNYKEIEEQTGDAVNFISFFLGTNFYSDDFMFLQKLYNILPEKDKKKLRKTRGFYNLQDDTL